jgi:small subunit ribosomal protein S17
MSANAQQSERGNRRVIAGVVTSDKMDKTVVVTVTRRFRDKHFHKFVIRREKYHAHDPENTANTGDQVELVEARPHSKTKRWRLSRVIKKSREVAQ